MTSRHAVKVCHACAVVVANADTSHLSDDQERRVVAALERIGPMMLDLSVDGIVDGWVVSEMYNKCECCGDSTFGADSYYAYPIERG